MNRLFSSFFCFPSLLCAPTSTRSAKSHDNILLILSKPPASSAEYGEYTTEITTQRTSRTVTGQDPCRNPKWQPQVPRRTFGLGRPRNTENFTICFIHRGLYLCEDAIV